MKIGIDASQLAFPGSGVARYTNSLLRALSTYGSDHSYSVFFSSLRQKFPPDLEKLKNVHVRKYIMPPTLLDTMWNRVHRVSIERFLGNVDLFFSSDWAEPPSQRAKKITTIHDLTVYKYPETYRSASFTLSNMAILADIVATQKRRLGWVKQESQRIICDSEATKNDVMEILKIDEARLRVVYPGVNVDTEHTAPWKDLQTKFRIERPFILTVGKIEPRKNIPRLIEAFKNTGISDVDLLIVGPTGWGGGGTGKQENVRFLGFVSDQELHTLYKHTIAFIFPSLYEGFGYPVVEAMNFSCPVATSNTSSLAEIARDTGLLFNPESVEEITHTIQTLYKDKELREKLGKKSLKRAKDFSLERFANGVLKVFGELA